MSIATKTGDDGTTGLMFNRRVSKCHPRVEACGAVDELNASLGLARAVATLEFVRGILAAVQKDLVPLMGELATDAQDAERYVKSGYPVVGGDRLEQLEQWIKDLEARHVAFDGWARPGDSLESASLDLARTVCRRAERRVCAQEESGQSLNPRVVVYLNRLSDLLWLLARWVDAQRAGPAGRTLV